MEGSTDRGRAIDPGDILGLALAAQAARKSKRRKVPTATATATVETKAAAAATATVERKPTARTHGWAVEVDRLTPAQRSRFEALRTTTFSHEDVSDMIRPFAFVRRTDPIEFSEFHVSVVAACTKMFVGDLVRDALVHRDPGHPGDPGPLTAREVEEAAARNPLSKILPDYCPVLKRTDRSIEAVPVNAGDLEADRLYRAIFGECN